MRITKPLLILLLLLGFAGCSSKVVMPPITPNGDQQRLTGKFIWFDLFSTDTKACEIFYTSLFGWEFKQTSPDDADVQTILLDGQPIGNIFRRDANPAGSQWLLFISVPNVDHALNTAKMGGGIVHKISEDLPDRGRTGIALDPQEAPFGLLASSSGDPKDAPPRANFWLGGELWTSDADAAASFYKAVVGYDEKRVNVNDKTEYMMLTSQGRRRGGIVTIPWEGMKPEWVPFVAVTDIDVALNKVVPDGGRILIAPNLAVKESRVAIIADPSGAIIGLHEMR